MKQQSTHTRTVSYSQTRSLLGYSVWVNFVCRKAHTSIMTTLCVRECVCVCMCTLRSQGIIQFCLIS